MSIGSPAPGAPAMEFPGNRCLPRTDSRAKDGRAVHGSSRADEPERDGRSA